MTSSALPTLVGVDMGCASCHVTKADGAIVLNELGGISHGSFVAFNARARLVGEAAVSQVGANPANTIAAPQCLCDVKHSEWANTPIAQHALCSHSAGPKGGDVVVEVDMYGELASFDGLTLTSMLLAKLLSRAIESGVGSGGGGDGGGGGVGDISAAISCSPSFSAEQRRALVDAAKVAGFTNAYVYPANDCAAALYTKKHGLAEGETSKTVVVVDIGHRQTCVSVFRVYRRQQPPQEKTATATTTTRTVTKKGGAGECCCQMLAVESRDNLGCLYFDFAVFRHFQEVIASKYGTTITPNSKQGFRLLGACERLRKLLSTIAEASTSVENLANDMDIPLTLSRHELQQICSPLLDELREVLRSALEKAKAEYERLQTVAVTSSCSSSLQPTPACDGSAKEDQLPAGQAADTTTTTSPPPSLPEASSDKDNDDMEKIVANDDDISKSSRGGGEEEEKPVVVQADQNGTAEPAAAQDGQPMEVDMPPFNLDAVELAGGGCRMGLVRDTVTEEWSWGDRPYGSKLDSSALAYGAALLAAGKEAGGVAIEGGSKGTYEDVPGLSEDEIAALAAKEQKMKQTDDMADAVSDARNSMESFVYDMRGVPDRKHGEKVDRVRLQAALDEAEDWLYSEEAEKASLEAIQEKVKKVKTLITEDIAKEYFNGLEQERVAMEKQLDDESKKAAEEREKAGDDDEDHDNRKLKKPERMRMVLKNKEEGNELFQGGSYRIAGARYAKALSHCAKLYDLSAEDEIEVNAVRLSLYLNLSQCYLKMEQYDQVIANCGHALKIDENSVKALYRRAYATCAAKKDWENAKKDLELALKLAPEDKAVIQLMAKVDQALKKQEAKEKKMWSKAFS